MGDTFAENLRERLRALNMSQREFADQLGVTEATVSRYLKGERKPSLNVIGKIAKILDTTPDFLLDPETTNADNTVANIKNLIARNAQNMTQDDKIQLIRMLTEEK
ncbi:MAG: helix-turn-helix transcriptional regulator [Proteobacteria bacterium]|nr:helix-turn-helix transcriptional regulator [Pseudomonadota bacterium]